jgi:hypothetical protein
MVCCLLAPFFGGSPTALFIERVTAHARLSGVRELVNILRGG